MKKTLRTLKANGLEKSSTYKWILSDIEETIKRHNVLEFLANLPYPDPILLPYTIFREVCSDYDMSIDLLSEYGGDIPMGILTKVKEVKEKLRNNTTYNGRFGKVDESTSLWRVTAMEVRNSGNHRDRASKIRDKALSQYKKNNIPWITTGLYPCLDELQRKDPYLKFTGLLSNQIVRTGGYIYLDNEKVGMSLMIAANPKGYKVIFQVAPEGVVVYAVWNNKSIWLC